MNILCSVNSIVHNNFINVNVPLDTPLVWLKFDTLTNSGSSGATNNMIITDL